MEMYEARNLLPRVGAERMEVPAVRDSTDENPQPKPCVVVAANLLHLWYMVRFDNGVRECYKVPKLIPKRTDTEYIPKAGSHKVKRARRKK